MFDISGSYVKIMQYTKGSKHLNEFDKSTKLTVY